MFTSKRPLSTDATVDDAKDAAALVGPEHAIHWARFYWVSKKHTSDLKQKTWAELKRNTEEVDQLVAKIQADTKVNIPDEVIKWRVANIFKNTKKQTTGQTAASGSTGLPPPPPPPPSTGPASKRDMYDPVRDI
ncbi:hypothetical protein P154DRAFT_621135 [Amniculicola lignicola CBS 123094]|uniref:Uncharacterized protein n=1 Tax=Amniculicola lignicola CBS 123094 TaxID=1392246 RepID=A0A6A5WCA9_9PLEO|nr:hypothetical protein P154DRAFT_621135 [Amniculicola lignicola CBS 123094]